jgi:hypothetical protein
MLIPFPANRVIRPMPPNMAIAVSQVAISASQLYKIDVREITISTEIKSNNHSTLRFVIPHPMTDLRESIIWEVPLPLRVGHHGYLTIWVGLQPANRQAKLGPAWLNMVPTQLRLHLTRPK